MRDALGRFIKGCKFPKLYRTKMSVSIKKSWTPERKKIYGLQLSGENNPFFGKTHTKEVKKMLSKKYKGNPAKFNSGIKNGMFGYIRTLAERKNLSIKLSGKNNPNWKGGLIGYIDHAIRFLEEGRDWARKILFRDNYTCQKCGRHNCSLAPHHIKSFNILLRNFLKQYSQFSPIEDKEILIRLAITYMPFWELTNGITFCQECHNAFHHIFGKGENDENQLNIFMKKEVGTCH